MRVLLWLGPEDETQAAAERVKPERAKRAQAPLRGASALAPCVGTQDASQLGHFWHLSRRPARERLLRRGRYNTIKKTGRRGIWWTAARPHSRTAHANSARPSLARAATALNSATGACAPSAGSSRSTVSRTGAPSDSRRWWAWSIRPAAASDRRGCSRRRANRASWSS